MNDKTDNHLNTKIKSLNIARNSLIRWLRSFVQANELMAAPKQQFAYSSTHRTADFRQSVVPERAIVSANSEVVSHAGARPYGKNSNLDDPFDKIINTRNAIIALFIMLILLLTLQAPVCCDNAITSVTLPAAVEQALRPAQAQPAPVNKPVTVAVTARTKAEITQAGITKAVPIKAAQARVVTTRLASAETVMSKPAQIADVAVLEHAAIAPASGPGQSATTANEDIKTDAAATLSSVTDAGYIKISNYGEALDDKVARWECVEDKSSKLTWEVKKNDGGIRDKGHLYSWLSKINGEAEGRSNGGRCKGGVRCDTSSYAHAMNEQKLCGYSDWRMPTRSELETLVEYKNNPAEATINRKYFPEAIPSWYWSSSENTNREGYAWYVLFRNGVSLNDLKERPKHIRLVRGRVQQ